MRDMIQTVRAIVADPQESFVFVQIQGLLVDQLMSIGNAIVPSKPGEAELVKWLQGELFKLAQQLPKEMPNGQ